mmetsp:Transcript_22470/g.33109  ORF Transcript_22470/g.33109 Transcript_22470/m.33109 type:complete len:81 (+) Transcript_22470:2875-3117(+)
MCVKRIVDLNHTRAVRIRCLEFSFLWKKWNHPCILCAISNKIPLLKLYNVDFHIIKLTRQGSKEAMISQSISAGAIDNNV